MNPEDMDRTKAYQFQWHEWPQWSKILASLPAETAVRLEFCQSVLLCALTIPLGDLEVQIHLPLVAVDSEQCTFNYYQFTTTQTLHCVRFDIPPSQTFGTDFTSTHNYLLLSSFPYMKIERFDEKNQILSRMEHYTWKHDQRYEIILSQTQFHLLWQSLSTFHPQHLILSWGKSRPLEWQVATNSGQIHVLLSPCEI